MGPQVSNACRTPQTPSTQKATYTQNNQNSQRATDRSTSLRDNLTTYNTVIQWTRAMHDAPERASLLTANVNDEVPIRRSLQNARNYDVTLE